MSTSVASALGTARRGSTDTHTTLHHSTPGTESITTQHSTAGTREAREARQTEIKRMIT